MRNYIFFSCLAAIFGAAPLLSAQAEYRAFSAPEQAALSPSAGSETGYKVGHVAIQGNQRVEDSTIMAYLGLAEGSDYTDTSLAAALKSLFATGFFADARIIPAVTSGGRVNLTVSVVENPVINEIAFEGNKAVEDKDLEPELELRARAVYTRTKLQADVKRLLDIYRRGGRYSAQITPKVIKLDQNRVNLVYEIQEGPVAQVDKVSFIGNNNFDSTTLRKIIRTEESRWYKFLSSDDKYDPERLQYDQELLRRYYTSEGFADFQVKSAYAELSPAKDSFNITFTLDEGQKYTFGAISVKTSVKGLDAGKLRQQLTTAEGETYNSSQIESSIDALVKELGNSGYAFVEVDPKLDRNMDKRTIDVSFELKEGPRVYVEKVNITGNVRTLDEVIRREMRLAEGDPYSTAKLARTEQRLNNLGFFEKVRITNTPGTSPDKTVINIDVREKSTGEISLGGGYSTTDGPLAEAGIRESNLLGRGQDLRFSTTLSGIRQQFDIGFTEPYFLDRELSAGFDLFKTELDNSSQIPYEMRTNGGRLRMGYALTEKWQHNLNYTYKETNIGNIQSNASIFIRQQAGTTAESSVGHALTYENRDNKFQPTSGTYLRFSQDVAGLGGDTHYLRNELRGGYYYPVAPKWTASIAGSGGYIFGFDEDIGIQNRFYLGGRTFRGFDNYGIGPHSKSTGDALGGNMYYTISPELTFPLGLPDDLGFLGSIFVDAGSLWHVDTNDPDIQDEPKLRLAAGVGLSWASPFGPIRIDLSHAALKDRYDNTQTFQFNFGTRF